MGKNTAADLLSRQHPDKDWEKKEISLKSVLMS